MVYLVLGKILNPIWQFFVCYRANSIGTNGQILYKNLVMWSRWSWVIRFLRLIHITAFSACVCGRRLRCSAEIEKFLSLHWRSPLRNLQTAAASVNEPLEREIVPSSKYFQLNCDNSWIFDKYFKPMRACVNRFGIRNWRCLSGRSRYFSIYWKSSLALFKPFEVD